MLREWLCYLNFSGLFYYVSLKYSLKYKTNMVDHFFLLVRSLFTTMGSRLHSFVSKYQNTPSIDDSQDTTKIALRFNLIGDRVVAFQSALTCDLSLGLSFVPSSPLLVLDTIEYCTHHRSSRGCLPFQSAILKGSTVELGLRRKGHGLESLFKRSRVSSRGRRVALSAFNFLSLSVLEALSDWFPTFFLRIVAKMLG